MTNQIDTQLTAETLCNGFLEYCADIEMHSDLYPPQPTDMHTDPVTGENHVYDAHDAEAEYPPGEGRLVGWGRIRLRLRLIDQPRRDACVYVWT